MIVNPSGTHSAGARPYAAFGDIQWMENRVLASYNTPGIHVLDATNLDAVTIQKKGDVNGYVYSVTLDNDRALCSMGPFGLDVVDLQ